MDYGKTLPYTGAGLMVGGTLIGLQWVVLAAAVLIILGAALIRVGWRRGKGVNHR